MFESGVNFLNVDSGSVEVLHVDSYVLHFLFRCQALLFPLFSNLPFQMQKIKGLSHLWISVDNWKLTLTFFM